MTKYKVVIGIIMTVVTLSCIIASSFAWFTASNSTVSGQGASMTAKDPSILTVSEDVFTIQDMGNYKGQTSFAFYRYIEDENNPAFDGKYILDKDGNKITKNFTVYDYDAQLRERKEFIWNNNHENVGIYSLTVTSSSVSGVLTGDSFLLKVTNKFEYSGTADEFYLRNVDGNVLVITDILGNQMYDDYLQSITIHGLLKTVDVDVSDSRISLKINELFNDYTTYDNTDNYTTVYDRLVSSDEAQRYSIRDIDGSVAYDSKNEDTEITFDKSSGITEVSKLVRTDTGTCKKSYEDADGNFTIEDKMFRIVKYANEGGAYYKIFDKALRPNCIYDGAIPGVTISVSEREITTYAIDDGKGMEDSAYRVGIQFEMLLNTTAQTEYFIQFTPNTLGIVPVRDTAKEMLSEITGTTIGDVYYTYIDADKIIFGLDVSESYINDVEKNTSVNNYEGNSKTVTNTHMYPISSSGGEYGSVRYDTTNGFDVYYSTDGGVTHQYLTYGVNVETAEKYVDIRGEKIKYDQTKHGDLRLALKTTNSFELFIRDDAEYSTVFDDKGVLINDDYKESLIFVYEQEGLSKCAIYSSITDGNRNRITEGLTNNTLYAERMSSVVYDKNGDKLYYAENGNTIATTKRLMYFLPLTTLYQNFTLEVDLIDHTNNSSWDSLTAEEKNALIKTYKVDSEGKLINADGSLVSFKTESNSTMQLYCVARIYYADPYTFENMHSDRELKYNYDYSLATPMFTVESSGALKHFAYSDYAFMGSHFLIRLNVEGGEKGGN